MNNILITAPVFQQTQLVRFMGEEGTVQRSGSTLGVDVNMEMTLGPEPLFGRVGPEAKIVLEEEELYAA